MPRIVKLFASLFFVIDIRDVVNAAANLCVISVFLRFDYFAVIVCPTLFSCTCWCDLECASFISATLYACTFVSYYAVLTSISAVTCIVDCFVSSNIYAFRFTACIFSAIDFRIFVHFDFLVTLRFLYNKTIV